MACNHCTSHLTQKKASDHDTHNLAEQEGSEMRVLQEMEEEEFDMSLKGMMMMQMYFYMGYDVVYLFKK